MAGWKNSQYTSFCVVEYTFSMIGDEDYGKYDNDGRVFDE